MRATISAIIAALVSCVALVTACVTSSETLPLPGHIKVNMTSPASNVPAEIAAFSGKWVGQWTSTFAGNLYVEKISADGATEGVYAWEDKPNWNIRGGAVRFRGQISGRALRFASGRTSFEFQMLSDGRLEGFRYAGGDTGYSITMTKVEQAKQPATTNPLYDSRWFEND
ncbi:MAG: hypothetical protein AAB403_13040 [Planctomycetota bacterium]